MLSKCNMFSIQNVVKVRKDLYTKEIYMVRVEEFNVPTCRSCGDDRHDLSPMHFRIVLMLISS